MASLTPAHRRNPSRSRRTPLRYTDTECPLKGSGKAGEVNGLDFDQYDRQYDGDWHSVNMSYSERIQEDGDNRRMEILTKKLQVINKMNNIPDELKRELTKLAYGNSEFVKDANFIAPEGEVEKASLNETVVIDIEWDSADETEDEGYDTDELCEDDE